MSAVEQETIRAEERLDVEAVDAWLRSLSSALELEGRPTVTQYAGGASNWTYRLRYPNRDLVLRRPPAGTRARSAHDMAREHRIQQSLATAFPVVPRMVGLCQDPAVLGVDFYVMEHLDGAIPRSRFPPEVKLDAASTRKLCDNMLELWVQLHRVDTTATGLDTLSKGPGYPRRQVEGWSGRYLKARTWNTPSFKYVMDWLKERTPEDVKSCVIHNDWRFDNVVLDHADPTHIIGVLDWELATIGDPLMDLGSALAYWVEADDDFFMRSTRRQPTCELGMLTRREVVDAYLEKSGLRPASWEFYEVFGLFRLAAIAQQIYYRYFHKQSRNPAFKTFWMLINYLHLRCRVIIRRAR